jgi:exodeoxyribonuclease III
VKIASWNVNSVRSRLDQLTAWLARAAPDVLCMQETKVEDALFPHEALAEVGYRCEIHGQKTYNGVAIASKFGLAMADVKRGLDGDAEDAHKRFIAATIEGVRVVCVYVPNGQSVGSPAYAYKLEWLSRLRDDLAKHCSASSDVVVLGDFNVTPEDIDVHDPKKWAGQLLCTPDERAALRNLMDFGLIDAFRAKHPGELGAFSWWDYRMGAFKKNRGLRIDLALSTRSLFERCGEVTIDKRPRELERPSDHAPVIIELA